MAYTEERNGFTMCFDYHLWSGEMEREMSDCLNFGEQWKLGDDEDTNWEIYWITDTGELYAVPWLDSDNRYIILGYFATAEDVERRMEGWRNCLIKDLTAFFLPPSHPAQKHAKARTEAKLKAWQNAVTINGNGHRN